MMDDLIKHIEISPDAIKPRTEVLAEQLAEFKKDAEFWRRQAAQSRCGLREAIKELQAIHRPRCWKCGKPMPGQLWHGRTEAEPCEDCKEQLNYPQAGKRYYGPRYKAVGPMPECYE